MGFSEAVQWWDEWQLRLLVLASLFLQYFLFITASLRRLRVPGWLRFLTWLAYLGSDAVAIYALAALFNHHRRQDWVSTHRSSAALEVLWAPVLLVHLGGQDLITAYNIEDNELWTRHILTAVSQVTVACYVFWKSWPTDKRLLQAAIVVFVPGILKCFEKPFALKSASINSLVKVKGEVKTCTSDENGKINSLDKYVQAAMKRVQGNEPSAMNNVQGEESSSTINNQGKESSGHIVGQGPYNLFVDLQYPYSVRLKNLEYMVQCKDDEAHSLVKSGLGKTFVRLYTKEQMLPTNVDVKSLVSRAFIWQNLKEQTLDVKSLVSRMFSWHNFKEQTLKVKSRLSTILDMRYIQEERLKLRRTRNQKLYKEEQNMGLLIREVVVSLTFVSIGLFHNSNREAYNATDVKITYTLLSCTAALEYLSFFVMLIWSDGQSQLKLEGFVPFLEEPWAEQVAQHNLIGCLARHLKHRWFRKLPFKHSCISSSDITKLVHDHVKDGWEHRIYDIATYRAFNDNRGQLTLEKEQRMDVEWSLRRPFDESVILWHFATDFCFHHTVMSSDKETSRRCRVISNYMAHLLYVNPEMLMTGARSSLFTRAYDELKGMLKETKLTALCECDLAKKLIQKVEEENMKKKDQIRVSVKEEDQTPVDMEEKDQIHLSVEEEDQTPVYMEKDQIRVSVEEEDMEEKDQISVSVEEEDKTPVNTGEEVGTGFVRDAWALAKVLMGSGSKEEKMWRVIEGVWVEMLCFSAGRCRGYLHAKSLGNGGEYLSYVWLLLAYMGMESQAERLQRIETRVLPVPARQSRRPLSRSPMF